MGNDLNSCSDCFSTRYTNILKPNLNIRNEGMKKSNSIQTPESKHSFRTSKKLHKISNDKKLKLALNSASYSNSRSSTMESSPNTRKSENYKPSIDDFKLIKVLGRGSSGKVYLVQHIFDSRYYALKSLKKSQISKKKELDNVLNEKLILQRSNHPFLVKLRYSFQSEHCLYLVIDYCAGGELFRTIKLRGRLDEKTVKFYAAEVVLALEYLHETLNVIYRDLKPENILLDNLGHIKISDFGLSKITNSKCFSFCGTPEYLAPELLTHRGYTKSVDWWSLGCLIFEMMAGYPPFQARDRKALFYDIMNKEPTYPIFFSNEAKDLLRRLICKNASIRLGSHKIEDIKNHPFFADINWSSIEEKVLEPPIRPLVTRHEDTRNFEKCYTNEPVMESPPENGFLLNDSLFDSEALDFTYARYNEISDGWKEAV